MTAIVKSVGAGEGVYAAGPRISAARYPPWITIQCDRPPRFGCVLPSEVAGVQQRELAVRQTLVQVLGVGGRDQRNDPDTGSEGSGFGSLRSWVAYSARQPRDEQGPRGPGIDEQ